MNVKIMLAGSIECQHIQANDGNLKSEHIKNIFIDYAQYVCNAMC